MSRSARREQGGNTSTYGQSVAARFLNLAASVPDGAYTDPGDETNDDLTPAGVSKTCLASLAQMAGPALTPEMRERLAAQGVRGTERAAEEAARATPSASQKKRERKKNAAARKKKEQEGEPAVEASYAYDAPVQPMAPAAHEPVAAAPVAAAPSATQREALDALLAGARVVIGGLQGRPELNGKHGTALSYDDARGRYAVRVDGGSESVLVRRANLTVATASVGDEAAAGRDDELDCPICLQLLLRPVTLGCGHNFCEACLHQAVSDGSQRCPTCRCPLPPGGALEPNRLLASLVRARNARAYDLREASSPRRHGAGRMDSLTWSLRVDYLSVASLIVLVVGRRIGAPLEASCQVRGMRWCDDKRRPEWQKDTPAESVPCLSGTPRGAAGQRCSGEAVHLVQPSAILSTLLAMWGGGRLRPPHAAGPLALARHDELVASAWDAVARPVALHLFHACWDGMPAFPVIEETARALRWVDAHVAAAGSFPSQDDAAKLTLLQVVAAVPCLLLLALGTGVQGRGGGAEHTSLVMDAMRAMPRFQAWVLAAHAMLGADVEALAQRSPQYAHYKRNLARAELQTLLMANGGFSRMQTRANVPLTKPPWPYESLSMSPGGRRDDAFVTELEYDAYQRRGDDAEGDSDRVSADEDDGFGMD